MVTWNAYNKLKLTFDAIYFPFVWTIYMIFQNNVSLPSKSRKPSSIFTHRTTTDIILKIEDCEFHAHRDILASRSRVLNDFLKQNTSHVVKIAGVSPRIMEIILNFMYTDELEMTCQDIVDIYTAAQKLRIMKIVVKCIQVLRGKSGKSLLFLYVASWKLDLKITKFISLRSILINLEVCLKRDEYLDLNIDQICEIVTEGFMNSEEYSAKNRFLLFMMCVSWIDHKRNDRMKHAKRLMICVQFQKMKKEEIVQCSSHDLAYFIMQLPYVKYMVSSALDVATKEEDESGKS